MIINLSCLCVLFMWEEGSIWNLWDLWEQKSVWHVKSSGKTNLICELTSNSFVKICDT